MLSSVDSLYAVTQSSSFLIFFVTLFSSTVEALNKYSQQGGQQQFAEFYDRNGNANNWAVLVCTSKFWFNYRHVANVLSLYHSVKRLGIADSQIILMLADDMPCNARNPRPGTVFNNAQQHINLYGSEVEVDYRGNEVTVENLIRLLTNRLPPATPRSKRLLTDHQSNILIYLTGHGGEGFLKFQDSEEITNVDLADAIEQMWQKNRYHEMFLIADTCQSESMYQKVYSPNVLATSSSLVGEDSLSHHVDRTIGVYIIDRYTYYTLDFLERKVPAGRQSNRTMQDYLESCPKHQCLSTVGVRTDLYPKQPQKVRVTDFFGAVRRVRTLTETLTYPESWHPTLGERTRTIDNNENLAGEFAFVNPLPF